jgi:phage gpG-like protein
MPIFLDLARNIGNPQKGLSNIGEFALQITESGFRSESSPQGVPWPSLNPDYALRKSGPSILRESDRLHDTIRFEVQGDILVLGPDEDVPYHRIHQAGGRAGRGAIIPAREYIGATQQDATAFALIFLDHITDGL